MLGAGALALLARWVTGCGAVDDDSPAGPAGAVRPADLSFVEVTERTGIDFRSVCGGAEKDYILEVNGSGCALFDCDGDGDLDVFFVNGARFADDPAAAGAPPPSDRLYRNDGNWRFTDVTAEAGLLESAWGCGCAVADIDNDGDLDLHVANFGPDALWENDGKGRFRALGAASGVVAPGWGSSSAFVDYDRDGLVDLFVVDYLEFARENVVRRGPGSCEYKGQTILCGPIGLSRVPCVLYRNLGGARFEDVSERAGIARKDGYGLGVAIGDYDRDGWPDIYVASDSTENLLFHNLGDGTFEEIGLDLGVARNDAAVAQAGMGVEFAFVRNAEHEDLFVVNYEDDTNTFYRNESGRYFTEVTAAVGLGAPSLKYLGWACFFADFDLDRDLDLFVAQGHVVPQIDAVTSSAGYRQPNKLFLNDGRGKFADASDASGSGLAVRKCSRGAAYGDLDGDGDLDLVVCEIDDRVTILENVGPPRGHWLGVHALGTRSNRAAIGARITMTSAGETQARRVQSSAGYASHSELTARFGLGTSERVDELRVDWPSGTTEVFAVDGVDRVVRVEEGRGRVP